MVIPVNQQRLLSVGVMVDLEWGPQSGGHVRCWERFAEAAVESPELDLTIYYLGERRFEVTIATNVRYRILPPVLGTHRIPWLHERSRNTDLAPYHPALARQLLQHHVLHITSAFAFSRTARRVSRQYNIPLACSTHTDLPKFTQVYSDEILNRILGAGQLGKFVTDQMKLPEFLAKRMAQQYQRLAQDSDWVLISKRGDNLAKIVPSDRLSYLRRGINKQRFSPIHRDRDRLQSLLNIPPDATVLLFVGRVDDSKKVMTVAETARYLLDAGYPLHVLVVGAGTARAKVQQLLGAHVTLPGVLPQQELAWIYASADLFVFPSQSEVSPNAVIEAMASGLPVFVSAQDAGAQFIQQSGVDGVRVDGDSPQAWANCLIPYLEGVQLRRSIGLAARQRIEQDYPSWGDVLQQDLLPVWQHLRERTR